MVNGINCQNYQLLIGRKEMVVLRRAQSKTFDVILSLPRPVILSSSKDDPPRRLRICGTVPLRQAQSDSVVQSNSGAQSNTQYVILSSSFPVILSLPRPVILSSSKDDLRSKDDPKSKDKKGVLCRKNIAIVV